MTGRFDDMLQRSIPDFGEMRSAVAGVAAEFVTPGSVVLDLGCSRGGAIASVRELTAKLKPDAFPRYLGCEISEPMLEAARERFAELEDVQVVGLDLRERYPTVAPGAASVVLAVLTLQFVPINYRQRILSASFDALQSGGALIVVEKVIGRSTRLDEIFVKLYHRMKHDHGYSTEEIDRKAASLEGVLVPITEAWNRDALREAGFGPIDCLWRWMNFGAWVAVKP